MKKSISERAMEAIDSRSLAFPDSPVLLMVSGGSDSAALAYIARELHDAGVIGDIAMLHVNHKLRGEDAEADARFVSELAELLDIPLFLCEIDVASKAELTGENVEALARHERYLAANEALESLCLHAAAPLSEGRIFTAHTADDRVENFYMRSIVGTGPGGFRSMLYRNGPVARPLMDVSRDDLRLYLEQREQAGLPVVCSVEGALWCEDATNAHTDRFRAYVRHEIVSRAKERNPQLLEVLCRTMNLIADEEDMLEGMVDDLVEGCVVWVEQADGRTPDYDAGCVLTPELGKHPLPLQRRSVMRVLQLMLGPDARVETASIDAVLAAWSDGVACREAGVDAERDTAGCATATAACTDRTNDQVKGTVHAVVRSGYVTNIQGNLAVSANKRGVRLEPMAAFRARRKRS